MSWDVCTETMPIAKKDYNCDAAEWICNVSLQDDLYEPEDLAIIKQAKDEGWKIKKGTKYLRISGKFKGVWCTFRARLDLNDICHKYNIYIYPED